MHLVGELHAAGRCPDLRAGQPVEAVRRVSGLRARGHQQQESHSRAGAKVGYGDGVFAVVHAQFLDVSSVAQHLDRGLKGRLPFPCIVF